jgi:hypothetical protein
VLGTISISDINHALPRALPLLRAHGVRHTASSVANEKPTLEWPGVFITEYTNPCRNVLFDERRDANPFFHYIEAMWIIMGREDTKVLSHVLPRMLDYSDNGESFHGAYGYRLRNGFGFDQIEVAIHILKEKPTTRQVVLSIWSPLEDLGTKTKDMPCNDMIMLKVRRGRLNMTVNNRSNDAVLGCYGANAVQFSMLLMYLAARLGLSVGTYTQVSDSFHVYEDNPYWQAFGPAPKEPLSSNLYDRIGHFNLFEDQTARVDDELRTFFAAAEKSIAMKTPMPNVTLLQTRAAHDAACMWNSLYLHRAGDPAGAAVWSRSIRSPDWQLACLGWLQRRAKV